MIDFSFAHEWQAEILNTRPLILPQRHFVYPAQVEEVERGALEVMIYPADALPFLATCALGFAGPEVPTGVWSCPHPSWVCIAAGGYVYLVDTREPGSWEQIEYRPVTGVRPVAQSELLLFSGFHSVLGWGRDGKAWQTGRLTWDGLRLTGIEGEMLLGYGWEMKTDRELPFQVNLKTGEHAGGGYVP